MFPYEKEEAADPRDILGLAAFSFTNNLEFHPNLT